MTKLDLCGREVRQRDGGRHRWRKVASPITFGLLTSMCSTAPRGAALVTVATARHGGVRQYFISCVKSPYFICRFYELIATQIPQWDLPGSFIYAWSVSFVCSTLQIMALDKDPNCVLQLAMLGLMGYVTLKVAQIITNF